MKKFAALFFLFPAFLPAQQNRSFDPVMLSISSYVGKDTEMILAMRDFSENFKTLTFYDSANHDIVFDVSDIMQKKYFRKMMLNRHEGSLYKVKFKVTGIDERKILQGSLISFEIYFLDRLP